MQSPSFSDTKSNKRRALFMPRLAWAASMENVKSGYLTDENKPRYEQWLIIRVAANPLSMLEQEVLNALISCPHDLDPKTTGMPLYIR